MYRLCLIALLSLSSAFAEPSPNPSMTPVISEEKAKATELWNTAIEKFSARNFKEAIKLLEDYVNRYPGTPETIEARYHLAQSNLFIRNPTAAIPIFLSVIEIRGKSELGNEARTYLGQAYLDAAKFSEAYLVSDELLEQKDLGATFRAKALLIRAHAQAGLNQNLEAEKTLIAFQAIAESDPELERETANSFLVSLLLKSNRCDALPSAKSLPEDQAIDQITRKGVCILEMGTLLARASKRLSEEEIAQAADTLLTSLKNYRHDCEMPPLAVGKYGRTRFAAARKELTDKLHEGCRNVEKMLLETFHDRENLKSMVTKMQPKETRT